MRHAQFAQDAGQRGLEPCGGQRRSCRIFDGDGRTAHMDDKPVDRPDQATVAVRQGTGPRAMVTVLLLSTIAAVAAMLVIYLYFFAGPTPPPRA